MVAPEVEQEVEISNDRPRFSKLKHIPAHSNKKELQNDANHNINTEQKKVEESKKIESKKAETKKPEETKKPTKPVESKSSKVTPNRATKLPQKTNESKSTKVTPNRLEKVTPNNRSQSDEVTFLSNSTME